MCPSPQTCADHKIIDPVIEIPALHLGPLLPALLGSTYSTSMPARTPFSPSLTLFKEPQVGLKHKAPISKHVQPSPEEPLEVGKLRNS